MEKKTRGADQGANNDKKSRKDLKGDLFGAVTASVIALPLAIAFGVASLAPLGPDSIALGAFAGLLGCVFSGFFAALFGGTPAQVTGPTGPMTAVTTSFVAQAALLHEGHMTLVLLMLATTVILGGLVQIVLGLIGGGRVVQYMPYPVVAGFMNGIAVIIFLGQLRPFFGTWSESGIQWNLTTIIVGSVTIGAMLLTKKLSKTIPASIVALMAGVGCYILLGSLGYAPYTVDSNPMLVGRIPNPFADFDKFLGTLPFSHIGLTETFTAADIRLIMVSSVTLALLGSIDSLLTSLVADSVTGTKHNSRKELVGQGLGNICSGMMGGLAGAGATVRTLVNINAGGHSRISGMGHSILILITMLFLGPYAGWIPLSALAGILIITSITMIDRVSLKILKQNSAPFESFVMVTVTVLTVVIDLMVAVGVGCLMMMVYFVMKNARKPVIKEVQEEAHYVPNGEKVARESTVIKLQGQDTYVCKLTGSLFFGTSNNLSTFVNGDSRKTKWFVFCLSDVSYMDLTGAQSFAAMLNRLKDSGSSIWLSGIETIKTQRPELHLLLNKMGVYSLLPKERLCLDLSTALKSVEERILMESHSTSKV